MTPTMYSNIKTERRKKIMESGQSLWKNTSEYLKE